MADEPRWWVLREDVLTELLLRAHDGEDPGALLLEVFANSDTETIEGDE